MHYPKILTKNINFFHIKISCDSNRIQKDSQKNFQRIPMILKISHIWIFEFPTLHLEAENPFGLVAFQIHKIWPLMWDHQLLIKINKNPYYNGRSDRKNYETHHPGCTVIVRSADYFSRVVKKLNASVNVSWMGYRKDRKKEGRAVLFVVHSHAKHFVGKKIHALW